MNNKRLVSLTTCFILYGVLGITIQTCAANESSADPKAEQHFEKANEFHKIADYDAAITEYKAVISLSPKSAIAQNAQYWIGQIYFETRQFDDALSTFQELVDKFPSSVVVPTTKAMIERVQQAKKNKSLFEAVKKADVEQVRLLITEGADVDAKWVDVYDKNEEDTWPKDTERTALRHAVKAGKIELVKLLVEAGADVNAGKWPPLYQAVEENNMAIAEYLIDHGANVNYPQDWGPIWEAIHIGNIEMVKLLLAKGADINAGYMPALYNAIFENRKNIVELLIQHGADVNAKDTWELTPLFWSIHSDKLDIINLLIDNGADVNAKDQRGDTLVHFAAITGTTEVVKLLLESGANINTKNDNGQTALHVILDVRNSDYYSHSRQSKDTIELLLAKGADVNLKDKDGRTPLRFAAESADGEIVGLLLDKGAEIDAKDESGFTVLHYAARFGNKSAAELLIAKGADINAKDKQGHTPLYVAASYDYKVAEFLINKGADSSIRAESGRTLLQLAQQRKQAESTAPDMIFDGDPNSLFGRRIVCGDVDGDGYDDILIGAYQYNSYRGRVYLFYGGPDMDTTADLIFEGQNEGDWFGVAIVCGDIDNDGCEDIVIGACHYSEKRGRAYLYWGGDRDSMDANPDKIFSGEQEKGSLFGAGRPAVYDIDNDGYDDIILGAISSNNNTGRAYLYYGSTKDLMDTSHDLIFAAEDPIDQYQFGFHIACGNVDNDGYGDIVIGSNRCPRSKRQVRAHLYYGDSRSNMDAKADVIIEVKSEGSSRSSRYGREIVCVDQNRDGYDDVVICDSGYNEKQGRAYLFHGNSKRGLDTDPDMILDGEFRGCRYGHNAVCGDIDGDNMNDLIIGARDFRQGFGRVYVYWGKELAAPDPKPGRILTGENSKDFFGQGLACGDVNNDGFDDLVIGAYGYKAGAKQGRAYLYYGGPKKK